MKLVGNYVSLAGAEMATKVVNFAAFAYIARVAGPQGFGGLEFAASILLFAGLVVDLGLGPYGAREIARSPGDLPRIAGEVITARIGLALAAMVGVVMIAVLGAPSRDVARFLLIYGGCLLAMPMLLQWVFQGFDQMGTVAVANVIRTLAFAAFVFAFLRGAAGAWLVPVAEVVGVVATAAYCVIVYRNQFAAMPRPRWPVSRRVLREGSAIGLGQAFWAVRMFGGVVLLGWIATAQDVGYFAAAQRILGAVHSFVYLYYFNLLPSMSRAWLEGDGQLRTLIDGSMRIVLPGSVAGGLAWVLLAPTLTTLLYGQAFAPATTSLQWLAGVCVIAAINGHYRFGLIAAGRQSVEMMIQAAAAVLAIASIPFAYRAFGINGAAAALVGAELFVWAASWWCGRRLLGLSGPRPSSRPFEVVVVDEPARVAS